MTDRTNRKETPVLWLASASPRRQELLRNAGIPFAIKAANIPEVRAVGEDPEAFARRLAREKARTVWAQLPQAGEAFKVFVLGADTVVVTDGAVLGKPESAADAASMLRRLSGHTHEVITAVCLFAGERLEETQAERTRVTFDQLSEREIQEYVESREPMDKAGAYAIQGIASRWVKKIEGDYCNVVGLPVHLVFQMLRKYGGETFVASGPAGM